MKLDYSPLTEPVTDEMIKAYASKDTSWITPKVYLSIGFVLYLFLATPAVIGSYSSGHGLSVSIVAVLVITAVITAGVVAGAIYGTKLQARTTVRLKRFAEVNNAVLQQNVIAPTMNGMIFDEGHSRTLEASLAFENGLEIGNYTYVKGSGKNRVTYAYSYARMSLSRNLPHMVLDAKSNNFFGSNLPDAFDSSQKLVLEGDFNNHFNVYVPNGYERDALYVFTPDVMAVLVDKGAKHDMEITGNELFIFKSGKIKLDSEEDLRLVLSIVESIADELRDQSKRYIDERATQIHMTAGTTPSEAMPVVASAGRQLKQRTPVWAVLYFAFLLVTLFLPPFLPTDISNIYVAIAWPALFFMLIGFGIANFVRSLR